MRTSLMSVILCLLLILAVVSCNKNDGADNGDQQGIIDTVNAPIAEPQTDTAQPAGDTVQPAGDTAQAAGTEARDTVTTAEGLKYIDTQVGTGKEAVSGELVMVHYTGWLNEGGQRGKQFDSSVDSGQPLGFTIGAGEVIKGWEVGITGMKEGGKRTLLIPSAMAYGERGYPGYIPANADLIFDVELVRVGR